MEGKFYPINLDISDISILIIGLGNIGYKKMLSLVPIAKNIKIVSKDISKQRLEYISKLSNIRYHIKEYDKLDLLSCDMIFACTNDEDVQRQIMRDVKEEKRFILANYCMNKDKSNFSNMSVVKNENYAIAISTYKENPALSKKIRQNIEKNKILLDE